MFETRDDSRFSLFSSYMSLILAFTVSGLAFVLFLFNHESIYSTVSSAALQQANRLVGVLGIVVVFLLFNTCYYVLISYQRKRMAVLSAIFLGVGAVQLLGVVFNDPMQANPLADLIRDMAYGSLPRIMLGFGVLAASVMPFEDQLEIGSSRLIKVVPVAVAGLLVWSSQGFLELVTSRAHLLDLQLMQMLMEYVAATAFLLAVVSYLRTYSLTQNRFILHAASGFVVLIYAQAMKLTFGLPPDLTDAVYGSFEAVGLSVYFIAMFRNNIDIPLAQLVNAEKQIKLYAENLEKIVERRTAEIRQVNARFIREMDYARSIQQSLLPLKRLNFKKVVFYSEYYPCERLSGDFYDIYRIDDDHVGMYVLDVSGHGISAALMTMFCNNYIKSTERLIKRYRGLKPHRNLRHFYEEFNKMNFPEEMHMVIFFASYNLNTQVLTYSSGGMNCHPILVRQDGTWEYLDKSRGFPICRLSDFFEPEYVSEFIHLQDGDRLIFYTDGLVDKEKNQILDQEELVELMVQFRSKPVKTLNRELTERINHVAGQLDDDVTYFIMDIGA